MVDEKRLINYQTVEISKEEITEMFSEDSCIDLELVLENKKNWRAI